MVKDVYEINEDIDYGYACSLIRSAIEYEHLYDDEESAAKAVLDDRLYCIWKSGRKDTAKSAS